MLPHHRSVLLKRKKNSNFKICKNIFSNWNSLQGIEWVATAIGHVTGPLTITSVNINLILMNRLLNSNPHPFDSRKSSNMLPSISTRFVLNTNTNLCWSIVDIEICKNKISLFNRTLGVQTFTYNVYLPCHNRWFSTYIPNDQRHATIGWLFGQNRWTQRIASCDVLISGIYSDCCPASDSFEYLTIDRLDWLVARNMNSAPQYLVLYSFAVYHTLVVIVVRVVERNSIRNNLHWNAVVSYVVMLSNRYSHDFVCNLEWKNRERNIIQSVMNGNE